MFVPGGRNDIQHSDIQHNDIQHNEIQHNEAQHKGLICSAIMLCHVYLHYVECLGVPG